MRLNRKCGIHNIRMIKLKTVSKRKGQTIIQWTNIQRARHASEDALGKAKKRHHNKVQKWQTF